MSNIISLEHDSKYQEQIVEYKFLSELMIALAFIDKKLEILRVHTDSFGYDLILKVDDKIKFVQIKSCKKYGSTKSWNIHKSLLKNDNGIVLVISYIFEGESFILNYNLLKETKYQSCLDRAARKKDTLKYCQVKINDCKKVSIYQIADLFVNEQ